MINRFEVLRLNDNTIDFKGIDNKSEAAQISGDGVDWNKFVLDLNNVTFFDLSDLNNKKRSSDEIKKDCLSALTNSIIGPRWTIK